MGNNKAANIETSRYIMKINYMTFTIQNNTNMKHNMEFINNILN